MRNIMSWAAPGSVAHRGRRLQRHDPQEFPMRIAANIIAFLAAAAISGLTLGATIA
jgi:hypothetical protein